MHLYNLQSQDLKQFRELSETNFPQNTQTNVSTFHQWMVPSKHHGIQLQDLSGAKAEHCFKSEPEARAMRRRLLRGGEKQTHVMCFSLRTATFSRS